MSRNNSRLSNHVDPQEVEVVVMPAEHVEMNDIESGVDSAVINLVDDINDARNEYTALRGDHQALSEIATSLEEMSYLAMEGINASTGLEAQSLLTMQYGVNQHLKRVGMSLQFPSLESNEIGTLEKTILSVEGLGDAIGKVWDGLINVAKRALASIHTFFKEMLNFNEKMIAKFTKLKSQVMAIDDKATGTIKTSAAKRLAYGDTSGAKLDGLINAIVAGYESYLQNYTRNIVSKANGIVDELTSLDKNGMPTVNPEKVRKYIADEKADREALLKLGYGGAPRAEVNTTKGVQLITSRSALLPGGYRLVSTVPDMDKTAGAPGRAMMVIDECQFDIEADKQGGALDELPVLSKKRMLDYCDKMLDLAKAYNQAYDKSFDAGDKFWNLEDDAFHERVEKSFNSMIQLTDHQRKILAKDPSFSEGAKAGRQVGWFLLKWGTLASATVSALEGIAAGASVGWTLLCIPTTWGAGMLIFFLPVMAMATVMGGLMAKTLLGSKVNAAKDDAPINSDDPNAAVLYVLRGILSARSWIGEFTVETVFTTSEYFRKLAPALHDYVGDSIKAHLAAAKETTAAEPATA